MPPIVIAHHLVLTVYGAWLPNDIRGSMSTELRNPVHDALGALHHGRKRVQPVRREFLCFKDDAEQVLQDPVIEFDANDRMIIEQAVRDVIQREKYTCYAWVTMPDHIHGLIRKHKHTAEEIMQNFYSEIRLRLRGQHGRGLHHRVLGGHGWKVFLDSPDDIWRTIGYIEENPEKMGKPKQVYDFVTPYNNWPFHKVFKPNSPYVRRLRGE